MTFANTIATPGSAQHAAVVRELLTLLGGSATVIEEGTRDTDLLTAPLPAPGDVAEATDALRNPEQEQALDLLLHAVSELPEGTRAAIATGATRLITLGGDPALVEPSPNPVQSLVNTRLVETLAAINTVPETRIYYGTRSRLPFVGALQGEAGRLICSAALIAPDKLLTAAHCLCDRDRPGGPIREPQFVSFGPSTGSAVHAEVDLSDPRFIIRTAPCHASLPLRLESWDQGDLAILRLNKNLAHIAMLSHFGNDSELRARGEVDLVGFGQTELRAIKSQRTARLPVISFDCNTKNESADFGCSARERGGVIDAVAIDTNPRRHGRMRDACYGDSGGPVLLSDALSTKSEHILIGVISRKLPDKSCGDGTVFTRIDGALRSWLLKSLDAF